MSTQRNTIVLSMALAAFAFGCTPEALTDGTAAGANADPDRLCATCHGTDGRNAAPPHAVNGDTSTTLMSVGAHQQHLADGPTHKALACSDCHPVPAATSAAGHRDGTVQLAWGPLAVTGGAVPSFDRETGTCSSTYCHGDVASLKGGDNTRPSWNRVDGSQKSCGSCHGFPPPAPHPTGGRCVDCHGGKLEGDTLVLDEERHVNGQVDLAEETCSSCHGGPTSAAPPRGLQGETLTTQRAVGAHQVHLRAGLSKALTCGDCHTEPASGVASPGHKDGVVQLTWGALAKTGGQSPTWNGSTCSSTYCHGSAAPIWTKVDGSQSTCGSCHGAPPSTGKHAVHDGLSCSGCHEGIANNTTILDPSKHLDGKAEVLLRGGGSYAAGTCSAMACHGDMSW